MLYGKGAGVFPAANMILRDLVSVATSIKGAKPFMHDYPLWNERPVIPMGEIYSGYYLRFICLDVPGVMGKIATILGQNSINIESAHASKWKRKKESTASVHIFVEKSREKDILNALAQINKSKIIKGETTLIRIIGEASNVNS